MAASGHKKPTVAILGAGNLARAMASALRKSGYVIDQIVSRGRPASLLRARRLAGEIGASIAVFGEKRAIRADVVWLLIPDSQIAAAATSLRDTADWAGKVVLHSSGALTSDELLPLKKLGATVASAHPFMTFVQGSQPPLLGVPFALEGDAKAVRIARAIIKNLGGHPFSIRKRQKAAYHAWGMFSSPLLTALLAAGERVAVAAGFSRKAAKQLSLPILRQTLANYAAFGADESFSGPIARGDLETVRKHLRVLKKTSGVREVYVALARIALLDLPAKSRTALGRTLKSE